MENGIVLKTSEVLFNEQQHTYHRGDEQLSGITNLIHSVLQLGVYPDAPEKVKQIYIPQAGFYGSCVHHAIQSYELLGEDMEETLYPGKRHKTKDYGEVEFPAQDVHTELESYKKVKARMVMTSLASEYTVDFGSYASQIDGVWLNEDGDIYLVDYKTNNLDTYPGKAEGLQEYLSWQLSCYAFMFERLNPGRKVKGLLGLWLRGDDHQLWSIKRQSDEQVEKLLNTVALLGEDGWVYLNGELQVDVAESKPKVYSTADMAVPVEITKAIADLLRAEKIAKQMKEKLRELMEQNNVTKWECDEFTASIGKPSKSTSFNADLLKQDHPDLYKEYYNKKTTKKGSFKITAK